MANDENKIILEFPATNVEIEFGETITFDNISGFLNSDRVTYNGESLTEEIAHLENDKADNTKIAPEYDEEETYYRGDIVLYNGVLYECDNTDASGEFSPSDWKEITLGEGIEDVRDLLANYYTKSQIDLHFLGKTNPSGTGYLSLNRRGSTGAYSVSVGRLNEASAQSSFAEGENNTSSGYAAHSEGYGNNASGLMAHAEGVTTESSGYGSHSEGVGTIANHIGQHVFGTYNVADTSTAEPTAKGNYIEIVGNGTDDDRRRNARTLDWRGNETLMGDLTYNGNKSLTSEISRLDGKIDNLPSPMIFKGTLGVGGTIQSLPDASASNEGYTYKVITDGTYAGQTAKVGDVFTSNGSAWVLIPSGDEDNDTWRAIKVEGVEVLGNGISSGAVDFVGSDNIEVDFDGNGNKVEVKTKNIYTKKEVDDIIYNILPDDTASGSVANFATSLELPLKSLAVDVNAVQSAGTPTPATPLPISGWSEIAVRAYKKNIFDQDSWFISNGYTKNDDGSYYKATNPLNVKLWENKSGYSGQITLSFQYKYDNATQIGFYPIIRYTDGTQNIAYTTTTTVYATRTLTSASGKTVKEIVSSYGNNIGSTIKEFQIELGSVATAYEPYAGTTEVIELGGTYYGGHFTQDKNGHRQFEVTSKFATFTGANNESWNDYPSGNGFFIAQINDHITESYGDGKCNILPTAKTFSTLGIVFGINSKYIFLMQVKNSWNISTINELRNFLSVNNLQVVYTLAEPLIIDLPDGEPIITLNGTNNIYADTGDTSVVFKDSVNGYVEKKIASVQALALNT